MSDNSYIHKLQRARTKAAVSTRIILMLIVISGLVYAGFYFEFAGFGEETCGAVACENTHSLTSWILAAIMIFASIIAVAAVVGGLFAFFKWTRRNRMDTLSLLLEENKKDAPK